MLSDERARAYWLHIGKPERQPRVISPELQEFFAYIQNYSMSDHWLPSERANAIQKVFSVFGLCILGGSPHLTISADAMMWEVDGLPLGYSSCRGYSPTIREWVQLIRHRDLLVRRHLGVLSETSDDITYLLANDPANVERNEATPLVRWPR